jgi:hypothetical protein
VPAADHDARVRADLHDLIREASPLEKIGFNVAWDLLPMQVGGQPEPVMIPAWRIVLTKEQGFGQPDLFSPFFLKPGTVGVPEGPSRAALKQIVRDGIADLHTQERKIRDDAIASANGKLARP